MQSFLPRREAAQICALLLAAQSIALVGCARRDDATARLDELAAKVGALEKARAELKGELDELRARMKAKPEPDQGEPVGQFLIREMPRVRYDPDIIGPVPAAVEREVIRGPKGYINHGLFHALSISHKGEIIGTKSIGFFKNGKKDGEWREQPEPGAKLVTRTYRDGQLVPGDGG
jgi:outer membrane murein-binding lipoprotein Lpp